MAIHETNPELKPQLIARSCLDAWRVEITGTDLLTVATESGHRVQVGSLGGTTTIRVDIAGKSSFILVDDEGNCGIVSEDELHSRAAAAV